MKNFMVVVAATASTMGIGKRGLLPWNIPGDMAFFKRITSAVQDAIRKNVVIMGRKTWQVCELNTKFVQLLILSIRILYLSLFLENLNLLEIE